MSREIDKEIAEKVFGYKVKGYFYTNPVVEFVAEKRIPNYSTDIKDAFEIVEKLEPNDDEFRLCFNNKYWSCVFNYFKGDIPQHADTAPMAICLAALESVKRKQLIEVSE